MEFADEDAAKRAAALSQMAIAHTTVAENYLASAEKLQKSGTREICIDRVAALASFATANLADTIDAWHVDALLDMVDPLRREAG
jgi:hypothetical protein